MTIQYVGICSGAVLALLVSQTQASFTNVSVAPAQLVNGRWVYSVYANFTAATDQIVKVKDWQVTSGTMLNVQHSDTALPLGSWNPSWCTSEDQAVLSDSFVSITGLWNDQGTNLNWANGGPTIGTGAEWGLPALSSGGVTVGSTLKVKIMQIAGTNLQPTVFQFSAALKVEWRTSASQPTQSGNGTVTIPAPGALALCGMSLLCAGHSRRRCS